MTTDSRPLRLNVAMLKRLTELVDHDGCEGELEIVWLHHPQLDGEPQLSGYYAIMTDRPEEGWYPVLTFAENVKNDSTLPALLGLLADIRAAVGDPTGKLMQDELVEHCRRVTNAARKAKLLVDFWNERATESGTVGCAKEDAMILACGMIDWPNTLD